tara:strand:+ start:171 stop:1199 length:1029 start_codon:yes stop_codon:yes gene_type:complete
MANTTVPAELINTATPLGRRNIIINGDFNIYQRTQQATGVGSGATYPTADRWVLNGSTDGRLTMTAGTEAAPPESNVTVSCKLDCTTTDTSIGASEYCLLQQRIEGQNLQHVKKGTSGAKQLTASFWVKSETGTFTYVLELYDADNTRQVSKSFSVTSSWSKVELTFPADTTGAFGNDNNTSMYFQIWLHGGSNYTSGTLNETWNSVTDANRAPGISSFFSSTSNELYITAIQLEVGDVATEFEYLTKQEASMLCYRYYYKMTNQHDVMYGMNYNGNTADKGFVTYSLPVPMNHTPTTTETVGGGSHQANYHTLERLAFYINLTNGDASSGWVDYFDAEAEL